MAKKNSPLSNSDYDKIQKFLRVATETGEYLKKCSSCYIDVDKEIQMNEEQLKIAAAIKREFFPHKP